MASHRTQFILGSSLNIISGVEELDLFVEGRKVHELSRDSSISGHNKFQGRWKLPHAGVKLIERGDQILSVCSSHGVLPRHVIQLDHAAAAVQHQSKGFHDWPSKQHRGFARQQVHLHIAILAADAEGQTHSPSALHAGITAKVEGALAPHEDLGDVVVGLLEQHVAHKKGPWPDKKALAPSMAQSWRSHP